MPEGEFRDGHPRLTLELQTDMGSFSVAFVIDTGFEGDISVPLEILTKIVASPIGSRRHRLADGSISTIPLFTTTINWENEDKQVEVLVLGSQPLIGTSLMQDLVLTVEMFDGGNVTLESL